MSAGTGGFLGYLERIRDAETRRMLPLLPKGGRLLEIGAGSGWQARALAAQGFDVEAIDVNSSEYRHSRVWPVQEYDGHRIPFPDESFDVVFSSNVLEHVPHVVDFQREIQRVLKPSGIALHAMPSSTWRLWTLLMHYPWMATQLVRHATGSHRAFRAGPTADTTAPVPPEPATTPSHGSVLSRLLTWTLPPRHGERGSALSECWLFSRFAWKPLFRDAGFSSVKVVPLRVAYTGYLVLGERATLRVRSAASRLVGSSALAYRMERSRGVR